MENLITKVIKSGDRVAVILKSLISEGIFSLEDLFSNDENELNNFNLKKFECIKLLTLY